MAKPMTAAADLPPTNKALLPAVHFIGFRDDRYWNAVRIWGQPDFVHITFDRYAAQDIAPWDVAVFAEGDWHQEPRSFNGPDLAKV